MEDEQLQANARKVGDHLKGRLQGLKQQYSLIGAVHGMGLYMGLEFVRDHVSLEPATEETMALCDRLLELGIIMQPTGDHLNIFKIKPLFASREKALITSRIRWNRYCKRDGNKKNISAANGPSMLLETLWWRMVSIWQKLFCHMLISGIDVRTCD